LMRVAGAYWRGEGPEGPSAPPRGGQEARSPAPGHRAGPAVVPRRARRRPGRVAPEGRHRAQADGGLQPGTPRGGGL
jgi:hypothetical protein